MKQIENQTEHHRARIIGTITAVHFLLSAALLFLSGAVSMSRFDGGGPSDFTAHLVNDVFAILMFPLASGFMLLKIANTGMWGWLLFLANSALWGWIGWRTIRFWRSRHNSVVESL